jgi:hypothetical protein
MSTSKKKSFVIQDFTDAGTETKFAASTEGKPETLVDIEPGAFGNYAAAGLVREPTKSSGKAVA